MSLQILHGPTAAAVAAATSQEAQRAALIAAWAGSDVTVRAMSDATLRETETYGPWVLGSSTPRNMTLGPLLARSVSSTGAPKLFVFRAGSTDIFSLTASVSPAIGDVVLPAASGGISALARTNLSDSVIGKVTVTANPALPVVDVVATGFTLNVSPSSALNNIGAVVTVTPNGPIPSGGLSVLLSASNGGVLGVPSFSFTGGSTAGQSTSVTRTSTGVSTVAMTNTGGLSNPAAQNFSSTGDIPASTGTPAPFNLTSMSTGALPFSMGFAMAKGHVPSGTSLTFSGATAKMKILATWPDGSARHGVVAGTYISSGSPVTVTPAVSTVSAGTLLTGSAIQTAMAGATAVFGCGALGSVTFSGSDFASPFHVHAATDGFIEAIYRKPVGSDPHLVAWMRVRRHADSRLSFRPWLENGFVNVASPSNKNEIYTFTLAGTERYNSGTALDIKHHQRVPLVSGTTLEHWIGGDPGVTVLHDRAYLQATELVPSVFANMAAGAAEVTRLPSTFTPLEQGVFDYGSDSMASTGYQRPIGPLPSHEVIYLTCHASDQATMARVVDRGGLNAGRYGIHYRDEATNRPLRFSDHPTRVIADGQGFKDNGSSTTGTRTPVATGGNPPQWDTAHSPAVGYFAYLLTGDFYHLETALFAATVNYLGNGDNALLRTGASGLVQTAVNAWQTRACAWDWRSKVMALALIPDAEPAPGGSGNTLRQELINCVEANVAHFHGRYVAQANNDFGLILPGETYGTAPGVLDEIAIWQQHFVTAMFGWSVCMDLPIGATPKSNLAAFFQWKAKSSVQTLGTSTEFWYINASAYTIKLGGTPRGQSAWTAGTGPWPVNAAALYAATITPSAPAWFGSTDGTLAGEFLPDYTAACTSMQGNMMPALAYAVRLAVPGASAAYNRLTAATNWSNYVTAFNARPTWAHKPLVDPVVTPAWMSSAGLNRYTALPNSTGSGGAAADIWGAFSVDENLNVYFAAPGGHGDSYDNRVSKYAAGVDSPTGWVVVNPSSNSGVPPANQAYYYDVGGINPKPGSRHSYDHQIYDEATQKIYLIGFLGTYPNGGSANTLDGFDVLSNVWDAPGTHPLTGTSAVIDNSGVVYGVAQAGRSGPVFYKADGLQYKWQPGSPTKTQLYTQYDGPVGYGPFGYLGRFPTRYDSLRDALFSLQSGDGQGYGDGLIHAGQVLSPSSGSPTGRAITFNPSAAFTQLQNDLPSYGGMDYDRLRDRFVFLAAGTFSSGGGILTHDSFRLYDIVPNSSAVWDVQFTTIASTAVDPGPGVSSGAGVNGRLAYVERGGIGGFLYQPKSSAGLFFFRTT